MPTIKDIFLIGHADLFLIYYRLFKQTLHFLQHCEKMSIQYTVLGFKRMTFDTWVSSHNH